jgi:hypothetical protein
MRKIVKIARDAGYNGYLPIESLPMGRKDYDTPRRTAPHAQGIESRDRASEALAWGRGSTACCPSLTLVSSATLPRKASLRGYRQILPLLDLSGI